MAHQGDIMRGLRRRASALPRRRRLGFEPLEGRHLLAALFVNSPLDNTVAGDGLVTLREAILASNNDTTTDLGHKGSFADEITFTFGREAPNTIVLTMGHLTVNGDLTIVGSGPDLLTIDASGSDIRPDDDDGTGTRLFDILLRQGLGWNVTLQGMTLTGGDASGRGGAIQSAGNLTLSSVRIIDNASLNNGGAIYATHWLELNNTTIVDNTSGGYGGGIHAVGGISVTLSNSIVTGNTARYTGGGLFIDDTVLTIDGGTISDNHAAAVGFRGGGLYARDTNVLATDTVIAGNDAAEGGGVFALRSRLTFNASQISDNKALTGKGGGIHIDVTFGGLTLNESRMTGNTSSVHGGAVYSRNSLVAVNDSLIADNEATHNAGGIMVRNEQLRIIRSRVTGNTAGSNGGGLVAYTVTSPAQASLYVADSLLDNNTAGGSGGGVYVYRLFAPTITRSTLHTNTANSGGAIHVREVTSIGVIESTLSGNHAVTSGGGVSSLDSRVSLAHSTVTGNSAASNPDGTGAGGGIIAYGETNIVLGHTIVAGNTERIAFGPDVLLFPGPGFGNPTLTAFYSLIGDNRGTGRAEAPVGSPDSAGNLVGDVNGQGVIDPKLSPLAYHGGQQFLDGSRLSTHLLLPGSPAIDAGNPTAAPGIGGVPMYDQRGAPFARVVDGDGMGGARIDMGALERQPNPLPGDYNFSGAVDAADFVVWRKNVGSTTNLKADGDGDGDIDQDDYNVWRTNIGRTYAGESAAAASASTIAEDGPQGSTSIGTPGQVRHSGTSTGSGNKARQIGAARQVRHHEASISGGTRTLNADLGLLAWLRTAGSAKSNDSDDGFLNVSRSERQDLDSGSFHALELAFASLGQLDAHSAN
jgi:hypothetical protein